LIRDTTGREKLAQIAVGAVAAGAGVAAGGVQIALGGWGLIERVRATRKAEWDAVAADVAGRLATEWARWREGSDNGAHAKAAFEDVVESCALDRAEIVAARLDAEALAAAMLVKAEAVLPEAYADRDPRNVEAYLARRFLLHVARTAFAALLANRDFMERLAPLLWQEVLKAVNGLAESVAALPDAIRREVETAIARLRDDLGAKDRLILGFIRTATQKDVAPEQIEATLFEMAVEWRDARGRADGGALASLTPDLSDLRAEAMAAHEADDVERFWTLLTELEWREAAALEALVVRRREIEAEEAALTAAHVETKRRAVAAAIARLDAEGAAKRIAEIVTLEMPDPAARFAALRAVQHTWYEQGRDQGLNLGLAVSAELARLAQAQGTDADQRGQALNDLGLSLVALGRRKVARALLEQAVDAYHAALGELTRERVPNDWAMIQTNLGNALAALGEREAGTARLEQAVEAHRAALEERTRDRVPLEWAKTQMNLGSALMALGRREAGTVRLEQAVDAYRAALGELTRERAPLDWASTQANLGIALATLSARGTAVTLLQEAVVAFRSALQERTRARAPLDWAITQMNLGNALRGIGLREGGTERLEQAVDAYRAALEELIRERAPLDWASTQMNLGNALANLGAREMGTARLAQAVDAYRSALEEFTREPVPLEWANARGNQAVAMVTLAERTRDAALAAQAAAQMAEAAAVLRECGHLAWAATFDRQIPAARALAERLAAR
jgi:tetratricopeptide (TPR) repeat protein